LTSHSEISRVATRTRHQKRVIISSMPFAICHLSCVPRFCQAAECRLRRETTMNETRGGVTAGARSSARIHIQCTHTRFICTCANLTHSQNRRRRIFKIKIFNTIYYFDKLNFNSLKRKKILRYVH